MSSDLTSLHLQAAFKSYLDNDDLEGLVSDIQIYLSDYMDADQIEELAHDWVVEKEGGLELSLQAFKRHPELAGDFIHFVAIFSKL